MPIDRDLAVEILRRKHPKVYDLYLRLKKKGVPYEGLDDDINTIDKLNLFLITWNVLDDMEKKARLAIYME